ncbi:acyl-CoA dehydrogenase C-terminal domain-containing protein, partial [Raoultella sp. 18098]|uniref:acyl-CoA dehydrogenase C-terminal domain-containing protein n=1 Tax=Raoultella sp. 18098 TaxID=2681430 RepID=UPI00190F9A95
AQHYRDARILPIYEGTTAIQANDLVGRKTARDGAATALGIAAQVRATADELRAAGTPETEAVAKRLGEACDAFEEVARFIAANTKADPNAAFAGSVPYLMLAGNLVAGWQMGRALLKARALLADGQGDAAFLQAKAATAR